MARKGKLKTWYHFQYVLFPSALFGQCESIQNPLSVKIEMKEVDPLVRIDEGSKVPRLN